jgi:hypothetical protein
MASEDDLQARGHTALYRLSHQQLARAERLETDNAALLAAVRELRGALGSLAIACLHEHDYEPLSAHSKYLRDRFEHIEAMKTKATAVYRNTARWAEGKGMQGG